MKIHKIQVYVLNVVNLATDQIICVYTQEKELPKNELLGDKM
jgi:hypothetical protein